MNLTCPLFITLLLTLLLEKSLSIDPNHYEDCKPFQCGGLTIRYPFYVPSKQPSFCGLEGFNVSCNSNNQTIINLGGDGYVINNISYVHLTINITNSAFSTSVLGCPSSIHNLTLEVDGRFNFSNNHKDLLLLQNCSRQTGIRGTTSYASIECEDNHEHQSTFLAVYDEEDFYQGDFGKCEKLVRVPYDEEGDNGDVSVIGTEGILTRGIVLNYVDTKNCSVCEQSGGRCGFTPTKDLKCFCPDRAHSGFCHPDPDPPKKNGNKLKITLISVIAGLGAIILVLLIIFYWKRRKNKSGPSTSPSRIMSFNRTRSDLEGGSINGVTLFSYFELEEATDNFDSMRELGEGGFGIVYHGKLRDGREVAVKRLFEKNYKRIEQFKNEIRILTDLRHQNLVTLYGCTTRHSRELLLVYEYIPNGTVADHLHGEQAKSRLLPWSTRMNIAIETATALSYLHFSDIIHRDVKTNNILLDNNFCVKVADFGLSRLFPADVTHVSTAPQGTPGYLDPEYHQCYHLTDKSDVYSFGVVLIELISSLPAVDVERHRHEINLSTYAMNRIQCCAFNELVDPKLGFETDFKVRRMTTLVAELAFQCLQHEREIRPSMEEVVESLKRIASVDYDALETEETHMSTSTKIMKPPPSPADNDDVGLLRDTHPQPRSPVSVMDKWLNSSKSTTPNSSTSSYKTTSS